MTAACVSRRCHCHICRILSFVRLPVVHEDGHEWVYEGMGSYGAFDSGEAWRNYRCRVCGQTRTADSAWRSGEMGWEEDAIRV